MCICATYPMFIGLEAVAEIGALKRFGDLQELDCMVIYLQRFRSIVTINLQVPGFANFKEISI